MLANWPEKKDQVLKTNVCSMAKLPIKHLFICCAHNYSEAIKNINNIKCDITIAHLLN